jgi:hypothetical protein
MANRAAGHVPPGVFGLIPAAETASLGRHIKTALG